MKIGFTGSRYGMTHPQITTVERLLNRYRPTECHHGDCVGSDAEFHQLVLRLSDKTKIVLHPPTDPKFRAWCHGNEFRDMAGYLTRNRHIVDETDVLIGTPKDIAKLTGGTWYTIKYAQQCRSPVIIVSPDGSFNNINEMKELSSRLSPYAEQNDR